MRVVRQPFLLSQISRGGSQITGIDPRLGISEQAVEPIAFEDSIDSGTGDIDPLIARYQKIRNCSSS
jgi:hypothetical protein